MTTARRLAAACLAAAVLSAAASAQREPLLPGVPRPPKEKPGKKVTPAMVAEAEAALRAAACAFRREGTESPADYCLHGQITAPVPPPLNALAPPRPPGPVDLIAFPDDTSDDELAVLAPWAARLPGLKTVDLGRTTRLTGKGLAHVARLPRLEALFLDRTTLTDADLAPLAAAPALRWLDLSGTPLAGDGFAALAAAPALQFVVLRDCRNLTADGVAALARLPHLRVLHLDLPPGGEGPVAAAVGGLQQLSELKLGGLTDRHAAEVARLVRLEALDVSVPAATAAPRAAPPRVPGPWRAGRTHPLFAPPLPAGPALAGWLPSAAPFLFPSDTRLTDYGVRELTRCGGLRALDLSGNPVSLDALPELADLGVLESLTLDRTDLTDGGLESVGGLRNLLSLRFRSTPGVTEDGFRPLARLSLLLTVDVSGNAVGASGARELADLPRLERLGLANTGLTDAGLRAVCRARGLQVLDLTGTRVTAARMPELGGLTQLRWLSLQSTNLTPDGVRSVAAVRSLTALNLWGNCPNVGPAEYAVVRQELPNCRVCGEACQVYGWPGAVDYPFKMPEVKPLKTFEPKPLVTKAPKVAGPPPPPPRVAPGVRAPAGTTPRSPKK